MRQAMNGILCKFLAEFRCPFLHILPREPSIDFSIRCTNIRFQTFYFFFLCRPVDVDGVNETAIIMSTSGSTGPSKGVCLSHAALAAEIDNTQPIYANEIIFNPSSLYW